MGRRMEGPAYRKRTQGPSDSTWYHMPLAMIVAAAVICGAIYAMSLWEQRRASRKVDAYLVQGTVSYRESASGAWLPAPQELAIHEGMEFRTDRADKAVMSLEEPCSVRLGAGTVMRVDALYHDQDELVVSLDLSDGRLWVVRSGKCKVVVSTKAGKFRALGRAAEFDCLEDTLVARAWRGDIWFVGTKSEAGRKIKSGTELAVGDIARSRKLAAKLDEWQTWNMRTLDGTVASAQPNQPGTAPAVPQAAGGAPPAGGPVAVSGGPSRVVNTAPGGGGSQPAYGGVAPQWQRPVPGPTAPRVASSTPPSSRGSGDTPPAAGGSGGGNRTTVAWKNSFEIPNYLSRKGLPATTYMPYKPLPQMATAKEEEVKQIYDYVSAVLDKKLRTYVRGPVKVDFLPFEAFVDDPASAGANAVIWRAESGSEYHRFQTVSGLDSGRIQQYAAEAHAVYWFNENARPRDGGDSGNQEESVGFQHWMYFKYVMEMSDTRTADWLLAPPKNSQRDPLSQYLALERDYGEYGVLYYVLNQVPPNY